MESMEQSHTDGNVKETDNKDLNYELIEKYEIPNSPFTAIRNDKEWFLVLGKYRLTDTLRTKEECIEDAQDASWFRVMQVVGIMLEEYDKKTEILKRLDSLEEKIK